MVAGCLSQSCWQLPGACQSSGVLQVTHTERGRERRQSVPESAPWAMGGVLPYTQHPQHMHHCHTTTSELRQTQHCNRCTLFATSIPLAAFALFFVGKLIFFSQVPLFFSFPSCFIFYFPVTKIK